VIQPTNSPTTLLPRQAGVTIGFSDQLMPLCRWWKTVRISGAYIQKNEEKMRKTWIAFLLGLPSFLVLMFVGETAGLIAAVTSFASSCCGGGTSTPTVRTGPSCWRWMQRHSS